MKKERKILLLLDNVSSHNPNLKDRFSNIRVIFLPKNTTSKLQPLDAGIIKNFKVHYRRLLLKQTLAQIDSADLSATAIVKSINVLTAIRWIKMACDKVKPETVIKCFKRTGAFPEDEESEEDPFAGLDDDGDEDKSSLEDLVHHFDVDTTADDYVNADDGLDTNLTFEDSDN